MECRLFLPAVTAEQRSSAPTDDQRLIAAFEPAMLGILPGQGEPVHAETLLALCLADGVLEVLEWAREGTGADPAASMWLASLRWYQLLSDDFPKDAPQPQVRPTDYALRRILEAGALKLVPGSAEESLAGLASGEMNLAPSRADGGPEVRGSAPGGDQDEGRRQSEQATRAATDGEAALSPALDRVLPIGLVPYVEPGMKLSWAKQAVRLTHRDPELIAASSRLAADVHRQGTQGASMRHADQFSGSLLNAAAPNADLPTENETPPVYSREISHHTGKNSVAGPRDCAGAGDGAEHPDAGAASPRNELLTVVVEDLAQRWRQAAL